MEDAATAEISRAQLWQWVRHGSRMTDGRAVSLGLVETLIAEEIAGIRESLGAERFARGRFEEARQLFLQMTRSEECPEFLTSLAYDLL
jgi:malate synthase